MTLTVKYIFACCVIQEVDLFLGIVVRKQGMKECIACLMSSFLVGVLNDNIALFVLIQMNTISKPLSNTTNLEFPSLANRSCAISFLLQKVSRPSKE